MMAVELRQNTRTGPMPSADEFAKYAATSPAAAEAIVQYMRDEQAHRHNMERLEVEAAVRGSDKVVDEEVRASKHGQWIFGTLASIAIAGAVWCGLVGATTPAVVLGAVAPILMGREVVIGWIRGKPHAREEPVPPSPTSDIPAEKPKKQGRR